MKIKIKLERDFEDKDESRMFEDLAQKCIQESKPPVDNILAIEVTEMVSIVEKYYELRVAKYVQKILDHVGIEDPSKEELSYYFGMVLDWIISELSDEIERLLKLSVQSKKYSS